MNRTPRPLLVSVLTGLWASVCLSWAPAPLDVVRDFGCPGDGTADASPAINRALREAGGRVVRVPPGTYLLRSSLVPVDGTRLDVAGDAEMRRAFDGGTGASGALINPDTARPVTDVVLSGGNFTNPGNRFTGRVINVIGDNWHVEGVRISSWAKPGSASVAIGTYGDDITLRKIHARGSPGEEGQAGVRVIAGRRVLVEACDMESGDDTFCAFPPEPLSAFGSRRDVTDVTFLHCVGRSTSARFLATGLTTAKVENRQDRNPVKVERIRFIHCRGTAADDRAAPAAIVINANDLPGAVVRDVSFTDCRVSTETKPGAAVRVTGEPGAAIEDVSFERLTASGGGKWVLWVTGDAVRRVSVRESALDGTGNTEATVLVRRASEFELLGSTIRAGEAMGVLLQDAPRAVVRDNRVSGIGAGRMGVRTASTEGRLTGNRVSSVNGTDPSRIRAVVEAPQVTGKNHVEANRVEAPN